MARARVDTYCVEDRPNVQDTSALLSSSWPAAVAPMRHRPQPPRAPLRRPCPASREPPPLMLPSSPLYSPKVVSRSRSPSEMSGTEDWPDEEACTFKFDENMSTEEGVDEEQAASSFDIRLVGLDDIDNEVSTGPASEHMKQRRPSEQIHSGNASPVLGVSPMLLSVIEQMVDKNRSDSMSE
mmetsp:Transcript_58148/g.109574  ORF Transcript_58148/g.109574 Transcript_58148/m.109574 type:complete len:182 (-) Transcript_58148:59-604(-)